MNIKGASKNTQYNVLAKFPILEGQRWMNCEGGALNNKTRDVIDINGNGKEDAHFAYSMCGGGSIITDEPALTMPLNELKKIASELKKNIVTQDDINGDRIGAKTVMLTTNGYGPNEFTDFPTKSLKQVVKEFNPQPETNDRAKWAIDLENKEFIIFTQENRSKRSK